jgi:hypothetical protein
MHRNLRICALGFLERVALQTLIYEDYKIIV